MNMTRAEVKEVANAIYNAGFRVYGVGNFDISREEFCNILMIALTKEDKAAYLNRYYEVLYGKAFVRDDYCAFWANVLSIGGVCKSLGPLIGYPASPFF